VIRTVEKISRITYTIEEPEVRALVIAHAKGPCVAPNTTITQTKEGGYIFATEWVESCEQGNRPDAT
jgi:hypothetical protein